MFSIPKSFCAVLTGAWAGGLLLGVLSLGGCTLQQHDPGPEPLNAAPIATDQAMEKRIWTPSPALYVNDSVVTFPDYAPLQAVALPYELNFFSEPALFIANAAYIPAGVFIEPAWKEQTFKSQSPPPSFTLMPPLPQGPEPTPR